MVGRPEIDFYVPKLVTEVYFEYYNDLSSEDKALFLNSVCWANLYMMGKYLEPYKRESRIYWPDEFHDKLVKRRRAKIEELEKKFPGSSMFYVPKSMVPRGSKAVSLIHQSILEAFPDRKIQSKKMQEIQILHRPIDVYLFPCKEEENDVLWVSYDNYHKQICAGFGRTDLELFFDFGMMLFAYPFATQVETMKELETVIKSYCDLLKYAYPYFKQFFEEYKSKACFE